MNKGPCVSLNIYKSDINLEEAIKNNENSFFIDLGECENKLREFYKLSSTQKLNIISVDAQTKMSNQPINDLDFEIYLDNGTQIEDLSPCKDIPISISVPITNLDIINYEEALIFEEQGYDIYDSSSEFYNDKCTAAYINGNDIIIDDRKKDIYPHNISICPDGCELNHTELKSKRFNCSCNIDFINQKNDSNNYEDIELNEQTEENFFTYFLDMINYKLFKCYKIIKNSKIQDYFSNVGFYLGFIVMTFNSISLCIFYFYFLFKIRLEIYKLIPNQLRLFEKIKEYKEKFKESNISFKEEEIISDKNLKKSKYKNKALISCSLKNKKNKNKNNKNKNKKNKLKLITQVDKTSNTDNFENPLQTKKNLVKREEFDLNFRDKIIINDKNIEPQEYNTLPYTQALRIDKRNIFRVFISLIKMKIEIINILFYPEEFTNRALLLSTYLLDFLFNYFMNALLYSDDVVSQKYHNNGSLDFITSLSLSLISNIVTSIISYIFQKLTNYHEYLQLLIKDVQNEQYFLLFFKKIYTSLKIKIVFYFLLNMLLCFGITYYLFIFCIIYKKSQISLLSNFFLGEAESLIKSFAVSLIVCILRVISLKCKLKRLYRTSIYLSDVL